jgi:integrase
MPSIVIPQHAPRFPFRDCQVIARPIPLTAAMSIERLTKRSIDATEPGSANVFIWDSELSGFGLKVTPTGRKVFILQYRIPGYGRHASAKRMTLGEYGSLTPDEARKLAKRELGRVAQGFDPVADRASRKGAVTVKQLGEGYLEEVRIRRKPTTAAEYGRLWNKHVVVALGSKPVKEVALADLRRLHRSLHATPYIANRLVAMLGAFFTFAEQEGVRDPRTNPAHGIEFFPETARERFLTPEEFKRLGEALTRAETEGLPPAPEHRRKPGRKDKQKHRPKTASVLIPANAFAVAAIRLLALTGCRESEILSLRWDEVDFDRGYLRLSDSKTGKAIRPLGQSAAAALAVLPRLEGNPYVLPGLKARDHLKEIKRLWHAVRHAAGLDELRLHDLRHSFASVPANTGESLLVVRSLLGHKRIATTERYAHLADDPVKRAADRTSENISAWLNST